MYIYINKIYIYIAYMFQHTYIKHTFNSVEWCLWKSAGSASLVAEHEDV